MSDAIIVFGSEVGRPSPTCGFDAKAAGALPHAKVSLPGGPPLNPPSLRPALNTPVDSLEVIFDYQHAAAEVKIAG